MKRRCHEEHANKHEIVRQQLGHRLIRHKLGDFWAGADDPKVQEHIESCEALYGTVPWLPETRCSVFGTTGLTRHDCRMR